MELQILNNGISIPVIGIGPAGVGFSGYSKGVTGIHLYAEKIYKKFIKNPSIEKKWVGNLAEAFNMGYTLLDNSASYSNWPQVAMAIDKSQKKRDELFITTRISNKLQFSGEQAIEDDIVRTLRLLKTDHIDLLQFHWPVTDYYIETWLVMEKMLKKGYCTTLGVANCHQHHLEAIIDAGMIVPAINQVEITPLFTQKTLITYCQKKGIAVQAYSPIARHDTRLFVLPALKQIARNHNKSAVQVVLRWHIQNNCIPIVRSSNVERLKENIDIFDFELSKEEMATIDGFNINARVRYDPDNCDFSVL